MLNDDLNLGDSRFMRVPEYLVKLASVQNELRFLHEAIRAARPENAAEEEMVRDMVMRRWQLWKWNIEGIATLRRN
jgi:hypothetical protein